SCAGGGRAPHPYDTPTADVGQTVLTPITPARPDAPAYRPPRRVVELHVTRGPIPGARSMASTPPFPLSDDDRRLLSARADAFLGALTQSTRADWEPYLDGLTGTVRTAVLLELVIIDMGYRWGRGERPVVEDYVRRFPELGPTDQIPTNLIL